MLFRSSPPFHVFIIPCTSQKSTCSSVRLPFYKKADGTFVSRSPSQYQVWTPVKHRKPKKSVTLERPTPVTRTRLVRTSSGWSRYPEIEEEVVVKQEVKKEESPINILRFNPSPSPVLDPNDTDYGLDYWFSLSHHLRRDIQIGRAHV